MKKGISDIESVDLGSNNSDSDSDFYNLDGSNEEDEVDQCRVWYEVNMQNIPSPPPRFPFTSKLGVAVDITSTATPLDSVELFFDYAMIVIIARETLRNTHLNGLSNILQKKDHSIKYERLRLKMR